MNIAPWWARPWVWRLDLLWRVPLLPLILLVAIGLVLFWKSLEWYYG